MSLFTQKERKVFLKLPTTKITPQKCSTLSSSGSLCRRVLVPHPFTSRGVSEWTFFCFKERDLPFQDKDLPPQEMKEKIRQLSDDVERLRGEKDFLLQSCGFHFISWYSLNLLKVGLNGWIFSWNEGEGSGLLLTCPEEWLMSQSGCYQFSSTKNTWFHAKQDCEQKGAHLVIFNDQEEEVFVFLPSLYSICIHLPLLTMKNTFFNHSGMLVFLLLLKVGSVWALKDALSYSQHGNGWMEANPPLSKTSQMFESRSSVISPQITVNWADADKIKLLTLHNPQVFFVLFVCFPGNGMETFPMARDVCFFKMICWQTGCKTTVRVCTTGFVRGSRSPKLWQYKTRQRSHTHTRTLIKGLFLACSYWLYHPQTPTRGRRRPKFSVSQIRDFYNLIIIICFRGIGPVVHVNRILKLVFWLRPIFKPVINPISQYQTLLVCVGERE